MTVRADARMDAGRTGVVTRRIQPDWDPRDWDMWEVEFTDGVRQYGDGGRVHWHPGRDLREDGSAPAPDRSRVGRTPPAKRAPRAGGPTCSVRAVAEELSEGRPARVRKRDVKRWLARAGVEVANGRARCPHEQAVNVGRENLK